MTLVRKAEDEAAALSRGVSSRRPLPSTPPSPTFGPLMRVGLPWGGTQGLFGQTLRKVSSHPYGDTENNLTKEGAVPSSGLSHGQCWVPMCREQTHAGSSSSFH